MKWAVAVCVLVAMPWSTPTWAQSEGVLEPAPVSRAVDKTPDLTQPTLKTAVAVWAAAVSADHITTYWFSSRYGEMLHEENVLIRGLDRRPAALVAAGVGIDAASAWAAYRLLGHHPRLAKIAFYGAAAYRAYLAVHNVHMMRRAEALRAGGRADPALR